METPENAPLSPEAQASLERGLEQAARGELGVWPDFMDELDGELK